MEEQNGEANNLSSGKFSEGNSIQFCKFHNEQRARCTRLNAMHAKLKTILYKYLCEMNAKQVHINRKCKCLRCM